MQILGPLLVIALIAVAVFIVTAARRQRAKLRRLFRRTARTLDLHYLERDDGTAEAMATPFDRAGFACFASPSLGRVVPENVVHGAVPEGHACLFTHYTRRTEGDARQWTVAIVEVRGKKKAHGLITLRNKTVVHVAEVGGMAEVDVSADPDFALFFEVRAEKKAEARACLDDPFRKEILDTTARLHFPVDLEIADGHIALYAAERNFTPERVRDLSELLFAARHLSGILARNG